MNVLDSREAWKDCYPKMVCHRISYVGFIKAHNHSLVTYLSWLCQPLSQGWWEDKSRRQIGKRDLKNVSSTLKTFCTRGFNLCQDASHDRWAFSIQEIEDVPLPLLDWTTTVKKSKENCVAFYQLCKKKSEKSPTLLQRIVLSEKCSVLVAWCCEPVEVEDMGSQRPETVYVSLQSSPTSIIRSAIWRTEVIGSLLTTVLLLETEKDFCGTIIFILSNSPYNMTLQQDGTSLYYKIPTKQHSAHKLWNKKMHEGGGPIPWLIQSPDFITRRIILWGYLTDQLVCKRLQNNPALNTKCRQAIARITENACKVVWKTCK